MRPAPVFSQRYLRKGPLVEETYRLFSGWKDDESTEANLESAFGDQFSTVSWAKEVRLTTSARLRNLDALRPLIVLARNGMKLDDWRDCWRLWIGATEEPFGGFVRDWLFPQMQSGRHHLRAEDAREYAISAWSRHSPKRPLSELWRRARGARPRPHGGATRTAVGRRPGEGLLRHSDQRRRPAVLRADDRRSGGLVGQGSRKRSLADDDDPGFGGACRRCCTCTSSAASTTRSPAASFS